MFLSQARGKVGSVVFSVIKGQQVERVYNPQPANPRSYAQQAQRALLANMTKFYKRGQDNFFKFAFEDKTSRESDFNAFARNNVMSGAYLTKEQYDAAGFPAIGRYVMTKGSIGTGMNVGWVGDFFGLLTNMTTGFTLGKISSEILASSPGVAAGDIVTFVMASSALDFNLQIPTQPTEWKIVQFIIDPNDTRSPSVIGLNTTTLGPAGINGFVGFEVDGTTSVSMGAICISRPTGQGVKVSTSELMLSPLGQVVYEWMASEYVKRQAAISWGGNPDAILAGGQLETLPAITSISIGGISTGPWVRRDIIWSGATVEVTVAGGDVRSTTSGGVYEIVFFGADMAEDMATRELSPAKTSSLTGTGSTGSISISIPASVRQFALDEGVYTPAQGFYALKYNGIVIAYGTMISQG